MPTYQFKLPDVGEGIAEAEIVAWHVAAGDRVEEDAPLADVMTDKATVEISSPVSARVARIVGEIGEEVAIGSVLVEFELEDEAPVGTGEVPHAVTETDGADRRAKAEPQPRRAAVSAVGAPSRTTAEEQVSPEATERIPAERRRAPASPAVRQRAKELGVDLTMVKVASGDRVRHGDLDAYLAYDRTYGVARGHAEDRQIRVVGLRRRIADNMSASKRTIPHFSYVEEIDVTKLEELRDDLNRTRGERPRLTILPLLVVALCKAVADFPMINARFDDDAGIVTRFGAVHLGVATQTENGLMVPVIRDAQALNVWQLASEVRRLADGARSGKATSAELSGSTLTMTSLGALGGIATTPVINRPEVAIVGPNRVVERPVVREGVVAIAKMMNLSISCDHRVVDGWDAASFVQRLKHLVETPALLFVD